MADMIDATHGLTVGATLGEGPVWSDGVLWFVDIKQQRIYRHDPGTGALDHWPSPEPVGWVLPAERGGFVAGLQSGLHHFSPDDGTFTVIAAVDAHLSTNRLNDAAVDPAGRLWFGTMDNNEHAPTGRLFRWPGGKAEVVETEAAPVCITNGPAISPDGQTLYHVDTLGKRVIAHAIDADGVLNGGRTFLTFGADDGNPDGAICDSEGGVWIGFFGGWAARRYDAGGAMTDEVRFPVANITKIALGGADGRTAYATTARLALDETALAAQPMAGDIFTFRVRIPGQAQVRIRH